MPLETELAKHENQIEFLSFLFIAQNCYTFYLHCDVLACISLVISGDAKCFVLPGVQKNYMPSKLPTAFLCYMFNGIHFSWRQYSQDLVTTPTNLGLLLSLPAEKLTSILSFLIIFLN